MPSSNFNARGDPHLSLWLNTRCQISLSLSLAQKHGATDISHFDEYLRATYIDTVRRRPCFHDEFALMARSRSSNVNFDEIQKKKRGPALIEALYKYAASGGRSTRAIIDLPARQFCPEQWHGIMNFVQRVSTSIINRYVNDSISIPVQYEYRITIGCWKKYSKKGLL